MMRFSAGRGARDAYTPRTDEDVAVGARYIDFLIPGLVGLGLMSSGLWGVGFALAEMRTRKLLEAVHRHADAARRSPRFVLSSFGALSLCVELPPLLIFARLAFQVRMHGSILVFALISVVGALTFAVMGLLLASRAENPQIVSGLINVVSFPMYLGSGVFFSTSHYPEGARRSHRCAATDRAHRCAAGDHERGRRILAPRFAVARNSPRVGAGLFRAGAEALSLALKGAV